MATERITEIEFGGYTPDSAGCTRVLRTANSDGNRRPSWFVASRVLVTVSEPRGIEDASTGSFPCRRSFVDISRDDQRCKQYAECPLCEPKFMTTRTLAHFLRLASSGTSGYINIDISATIHSESRLKPEYTLVSPGVWATLWGVADFPECSRRPLLFNRKQGYRTSYSVVSAVICRFC